MTAFFGDDLEEECLLCASASRGAPLCPACAADLPRLSPARCPCCAAPSPRGERCGRCLAHPPNFDSAQAVYRYAFPLDRLIQDYKYGHRLALGAFLGRELAGHPAIVRPPGPALVVPLPLHADRLRERGFNQALELARPLAQAWSLPLAGNVCRRIRPTRSQTELPHPARARNVRGAFGCTHALHGQTIVLVDDVMTTGATLSECARTLKRHGAARVTVCVVARAVPD